MKNRCTEVGNGGGDGKSGRRVVGSVVVCACILWYFRLLCCCLCVCVFVLCFFVGCSPSVAQLVERLTVVYTYCVSVYSEINWSPVRFWSFGRSFWNAFSHIHNRQQTLTAETKPFAFSHLDTSISASCFMSDSYF